MLDVVTNTLAFIVALGVIISVHEFGHLLAAKAFSVRVPVYSIGFGRALFRFRRGDTEYRLAWIPLGGYVRLAGDDPAEPTDDPDAFLSKPRWQRIVVYLAGPIANGLLAVLLMAGVFVVGVAVPVLPDLPPVVGEVEAGSPAAAAGIEAGDRIVRVDGDPIERWEQVRFAIMTSPGRPLRLGVAREGEGEEFETRLTPRVVSEYQVGDAGIYPRILPRVTQVLPDSPAAAAGFQAGDQLRSVDGRPAYDPREFVDYIEEHAGVPVVIEVERDGAVRSLEVTPAEEGGVGRIGVGIGYLQRYGPLAALRESVRYNWQIVRQTTAAVGKIVTGRLAAKSALSGPIEIAALSGAAARSGLRNLVHLMALVSVSIGLLNLFPVPVLDGGQILLLLVESAARRDLPLSVRERFQQVGFVLIIALMVMVIYFDLAKNLPAGWLPGS